MPPSPPPPSNSIEAWFSLLMAKPQNRSTKKPLQAFVLSSSDSLGLSADVAHAFICKKTL
jgi:hypothetical protein